MKATSWLWTAIRSLAGPQQLQDSALGAWVSGEEAPLRLELFTADQMARNYLGLYEELVARHAARDLAGAASVRPSGP